MRFLTIITISFLVLPLTCWGQFCTGSLGDNIFVEGDFGSGSANLLSPNPNIAPGYAYTFNVPPTDGQYVITNSTSTWQLWPSWLSLGDNSSDPNGYMMVVNASNSPGLFYEKTVSGLCENTLYEFTADIINLIQVGTPDHIDPDVSFLLDDVEFFTTGNIPKTNDWTTYGFTFVTQVGQETLTLSLRNNAPGGFGNDLALDNISFRACGPEISVLPESTITNSCEGATPIEFQATLIGNQYVNPAYQWQESFDEGLTWVDIAGANEQTYTHPQLTAGTYYYRFLVADGIGNLSSVNCRVNSTEKIINVLPLETFQSDTICEGLTLTVGNSTYTTTGIYMETFANFLGCDSIVVTDLTVLLDSDFMVDLIVTPPSCPNFSDASISIENVSNGIAPYSYNFEGVDSGMATLFTDLAGGETYSIVVEDAIGCDVDLSVTIEEPDELFLDLGDDQSIELGETIDLSPFYNFTPSDFSWESDTPINCLEFEDCLDLNFLPTMSQQVSLDLFASGGCSTSDSTYIEVIDVRKAWLPNVFSPNHDGINDFFTVYGNTSNVQVVEEFKIFNRWGAMVFEVENLLPNDLQSGWDGTFKGEESPEGIYLYTATVRFADEQVLGYTGDVLLIK